MSDVHHQTELVIGGRPIAPRLCRRCEAELPSHEPGCTNVLVVLPVDYRLDSSVPATRDDCPKPRGDGGARLCPHYHCRHNLWHVADEDRPGRRWKAGELPPTTPQLGLAGVEQRGPRTSDSEGENTLDLYTEDNCALDHLDRRPLGDRRNSDINWRTEMTHAEVAKVLGMTERQVRRVVRKALGKLKGDEDAMELLQLMLEEG